MLVASHKIPADCYPFTITIYEMTPFGPMILWTDTVIQPGILQVPGFGRPVRVRAAFANGQVFDADSLPTDVSRET